MRRIKRNSLVIAAAIAVIAGTAFQGLAQSRSVWVSPKNGVWKVVAEDVEHTKWSGTMKLNRVGQTKSIVKYTGYFYWLSDDKETEGREFFNGSFNRNTGKLRLKSYAVKNLKGDLGTGVYSASVNRKGRNIYRGVWGGDENVPGKWSAVWPKKR